jgi:hypothetical protein
MAYDTQPSTTASGISLGNRVDIIPGAALPDFNSVGGSAFAARMKHEAGAEIMAILCNANVMPRIDSITAMRSITHPAVLSLIDSGVVLWPQDDMRYYAFAFEKPTAPRMMQDINQPLTPMSEDALNHYFVYPLIAALSEFSRTGLVHHAVRPTNIFWRMGSSTPPQLGECLSAPPGYGQPVLFEPIERAMSLPRGRGVGSSADDCYALGVTIALLALGQNPMQGMDDATIIQTKIDRGSFNALVGTRRIAASHIELLRGLLSDDARQRWSTTDLEQWIHGRRLTPKNSDIGRRAGRHIHFEGKDYWQVRPLAAALAANVPAAVQLVEEGGLDKWMRRALGDEERANDVEEARVSLKENSKVTNYEDQLIARACIALDPQGPIRYRGLTIMPAGIADMLIDAVMTGNNIQALSEIISSQLVSFWVEMRKDSKTDAIPLLQQYERMRGVLEKNSLGNGIERVIYELNSGLPCLSPMIRTQYVTSAKALLPALERVATSGGRPHEPMDRHIAAFLGVRDRRGDMLFNNMSGQDQAKRGTAILTLYSEMQNRHGPDSLPALAQWLVPLIEPAIQRYLGKAIKEKLQAQLRDTATRGDLGALLRLVDDPNRIEHDRQQFRAARMLYLNTMKEIAHLEHTLANRESVIMRTGKPMAASLSSYLAILFVMLAILRAIWQYIIMG